MLAADFFFFFLISKKTQSTPIGRALSVSRIGRRLIRFSSKCNSSPQINSTFTSTLFEPQFHLFKCIKWVIVLNKLKLLFISLSMIYERFESFVLNVHNLLHLVLCNFVFFSVGSLFLSFFVAAATFISSEKENSSAMSGHGCVIESEKKKCV